MARYRPDEITYELFGINPDEFYKTKFACGKGLDNALAHPVHRYELTYEKIRRLIADLQSMAPAGAKVLDVGCGAAPYGPTLLRNVPGIVLHGVDLSRQCLEHASRNGYSHCELFNLTNRLPFEDDFFDFVFSMDTLGHIEFRHKDFLISEISRVTRPGGAGHHGVETGLVDYYDCQPLDEDDPVRRYVFVDGHIGAEPAQVVCNRFSRHFHEVSHRTTYLYPFVHKGALGELFEKDFSELLAQHSEAESVQLANIILGRLNSYFIDEYAKVFGDAFKPDDGYQSQVSEEHREARDKLFGLIREHNEMYGADFIEVPRRLFRPAGFSSISMRAAPTRHD